ncbi:uncharacterized protein LOC124357163 isoform X2 [Homalodisca vitripennis]|uniref:uncharacterized protein LOC124357163 isoform X2 n=1 Tax=Homalodisca vitripennis TaxID=197043 RepID=UPI001EEB5C8C|nr:uncharacterized protein LOC124357163 isoform X2 [Homalodisca vitripennis]
MTTKGSAVAMIGANLRYGSASPGNLTNATRVFQCHPGGETEATVIFVLGGLGMVANIALMTLILAKKQLRRWSQGLLFHQAIVDCARAAILIPLAVSIMRCEPVKKCSLVETAFLLLVTVSTVNMLTTVLNDSPVFPEDDEEEDDLSAPLLMDSPQCVLFGTFMIWFASITINLGPTFLSGALAANSEGMHNLPSCPLVHGPFRHYVLNVLWIFINVICVLLTLFHLHKLHRDLTKANVEAVRVAGLVTTLVSVTGGGNMPEMPTGVINHRAQGTNGAIPRPADEHRRMEHYLRRMEREGVQRVKMFLVITAAYVLFWGPLFLVTLLHHPILGYPLGYEITLHVAYVHAFVNPSLFLVLHRGLRTAALDLCCGCCVSLGGWLATLSQEESDVTPGVNLLLPPPPPVASLKPPPPALTLGNENMMYKEEPWSGSVKKQRPPAPGPTPLPPTAGAAALPFNGGGALPRFSDDESQQSSSSSE